MLTIATRKSTRQSKKPNRFDPAVEYERPQTKAEFFRRLPQLTSTKIDGDNSADCSVKNDRHVKEKKCKRHHGIMEPAPEEYLPYDEEEEEAFERMVYATLGENTAVNEVGFCPHPDKEGYFFVEDIIKRRQLQDGSWYFLIRWKGWPPEHDTWEPFSNLNEYGQNTVIQRYTRKSKEPLVETPAQKKRLAEVMEATRKLVNKRNKYRAKRAIPLDYDSDIEGKYDDTEDPNISRDVEYEPPTDENSENDDDDDNDKTYEFDFLDIENDIEDDIIEALVDELGEYLLNVDQEAEDDDGYRTPSKGNGKKLLSAITGKQVRVTPPVATVTPPPVNQGKLIRPDGSLWRFTHPTSENTTKKRPTSKKPCTPTKADKKTKVATPSNSIRNSKPKTAKRNTSCPPKGMEKFLANDEALKELHHFTAAEKKKVWMDVSNFLSKQLMKPRKKDCPATMKLLVELMKILTVVQASDKVKPRNESITNEDDDDNANHHQYGTCLSFASNDSNSGNAELVSDNASSSYNHEESESTFTCRNNDNLYRPKHYPTPSYQDAYDSNDYDDIDDDDNDIDSSGYCTQEEMVTKASSTKHKNHCGIRLFVEQDELDSCMDDDEVADF